MKRIKEEVEKIINNSEILVKSYIKNGWIIKNLEKNNILIENDFFVSLEPLVAWKNSNIDNTGIYELSKMRGKGDYYNSYYSFSGWEKRNIGEMCFYVLAKKY